MSNRKAAEKMILDFMKDIDKSGHNVEQWKKILSEMSDKDFDTYMKKIRDGEALLVAFAPAFVTKDMNVNNMHKVSKKYNIDLYEQLEIHDPVLGPYKTSQKYLIVDLPFKIMSQSLDKKSSFSDDNRVIDQLTYTPTGDSKGSTLSQPELNVLNSMGLHNSIQELFAVRGGDKGAMRAYNASVDRTGEVSLSAINPYRTGVQSTKVVKSYLRTVNLELEV